MNARPLFPTLLWCATFPALTALPEAPAPAPSPPAVAPNPAPGKPASAPAPVPLNDPRWVKAEDFDFGALLPAPPAKDAAITKGELELVVTMMKRIQPAQADRAAAEREMTPWSALKEVFQPAPFTPQAKPLTALLLTRVTEDTEAIVKAAKRHFARPRPAGLDPRIGTDHEMDLTAYPSGHATRAWVWARVLGLVRPDLAEALTDEAGIIGWGRVILGKHFPSDVAAGFALGEEIVQRLLRVPAFQESVLRARQDFRDDVGP